MEVKISVRLIRATLSTRTILTASAHTHTQGFMTDVVIFDAILARALDGFPNTPTGSLNVFGLRF